MKRTRQTFHDKEINEDIKGLSGVIELKGEDLSYEARQKFLQQQQRDWLNQQMREKQEQARREKENDMMYDLQTLEINRIRGQLENDFHGKKKNIEVNECDIAAHSLWWGDDGSAQAFREAFPQALTHTDVLLAGDVLYKKELLPLLFKTVSDFLTAGSARQFLLCHIPRADVTHDAVQEQIRSSGLQFELLELAHADQSSVLEVCPMEDVSRAKLYLIQRYE